MKYEIRVEKDGVVSSFEADIGSTKSSVLLDRARALLEKRGLSEVLLSVRTVVREPGKKR